MTKEGVMLIVVLTLALIKMVMAWRRGWRPTQLPGDLKAIITWDLLLFLGITLTMTSVITRIIVGLTALNAIVWAEYYIWLRRSKFRVIPWLALLIFGLFLQATYDTFETVPHWELWYYSMFVWGWSLVMILLYDVLSPLMKWLAAFLSWVVWAALGLVGLIFVGYHTAFEVPIQTAELNAIFQTNLVEAIEYARMVLGPVGLVAIVFVLLALLWMLLRYEHRGANRLNRSVFLYIVVALLLLINLDMPRRLALSNFIEKSYNDYHKELTAFRKELEKRRNLEGMDFQATKTGEKELYVVVIGESLNKFHMSLYGYHRETTPQMDQLHAKNELIKFEQAYSSHTHTIPVLTQALTEANQQNGMDFYNSLSLLDIFEKADFDTYWLSNQVMFGGWDNAVTAMSERADHMVRLNRNTGFNAFTSEHDGALLKELKSILTQPIEKNTVVFIHLMGNHHEYSSRYPEGYGKYFNEDGPAVFGREFYWWYMVNAYDNSVLYNDEVVAGIIEAVKEQNAVSACVYFADHGEDAIHGKGHSSGVFNFDMTQIPFLVWTSPQYRETYPDKVEQLQDHSALLFSNDLVYESLLGLTGIETDHYESGNDISNPAYALPPDSSLTMHGRRRYIDQENHHYHQLKNTQMLDSLGQLGRVFPHRVNTIGKLSSCFYLGHRSFELDLILRQTDDSAFFEVGHDDQTMSGMSLHQFLSEIPGGKFERVWLDIKNLDQDNMGIAAQVLAKLDQLYDLKSKAIVESGTTTLAFSQLSELGYHTSYYLPTGIKDLDRAQWADHAEAIAAQVERQKLKAVSFDIALYDFVKQELEKRLDKAVVYHTWDLFLGLMEPQFVRDLTNKNYYDDERIRTVLVRYHSNFEL